MQISIERIKPGYIYSPISETYDTRPAEIHSFLPDSEPHLFREFLDYLEEIPRQDKHRLRDNYIGQDFRSHSVISLWKRQGKPVGFATCWNRDFYNQNTIRVLNRIYHDSELSRVFFTREIARPATVHCLLQQMELVKNQGFEFAFISREQRASTFFKLFINKLNDYCDTNWTYRPGPFLVAPSNDFSCQQAIGVTKLQGEQTVDDFFSQWSQP